MAIHPYATHNICSFYCPISLAKGNNCNLYEEEENAHPNRWAASGPKDAFCSEGVGGGDGYKYRVSIADKQKEDEEEITPPPLPLSSKDTPSLTFSVSTLQ